MKSFRFLKSHIHFLILLFWFAVVLFVNIHINSFKYSGYDFGKFDLGNMTQMVWNTLHGRVLYLTDYFGSNVPRWSMSHVDPILLLFVPIFAVYQHPLTLVFSQVFLVLASCFIIFKLGILELKSKTASLLVALSFLFYPAIGYLTAQTGFHGVTAVIPFFLGAFYVFEKMYREKAFTTKNLIMFWVLLTLTMSGKEEIPLYIFLFSIFILIFRRTVETVRLAVSMGVISLLWFIIAFFVIIPANAHYRIESYQKFITSLNLQNSTTSDVENPNYFISRYEAFGDSYFSVAFGIASDPERAVRIFFGGDKVKNFTRTFEPVMYLPFVYPQILFLALPDLMINYLTTSVGIGTAEIENHRISMIVPVLFLSVIYAIGFLSRLLGRKSAKAVIMLEIVLSACLLTVNIKTTFSYNNPVYLWLNQALSKRFSAIPVFAKFDTGTAKVENLQIGTIHKIADLNDKDIECSDRVVSMIPDDATVSGPDYLGANLSMRETYAIFPALYKEADYVIVDVFSRKIFTILNIDNGAIKNVVEDLLRSKNYELLTGCGNLFVFKNVGEHQKSDLLPLQEKFSYPERYNFEIYNALFVVDFNIPAEVTRGVPSEARVVYIRKENKDISDFILYMTYLNMETGEIYQAVNLPSFSISEPQEWDPDAYYLEDIDVALPKYIDAGNYRVFIGMSNKIKTRNLYLGDILVK
jgi:uncharacterized membrane protein